jgi:hypothetical protein
MKHLTGFRPIRVVIGNDAGLLPRCETARHALVGRAGQFWILFRPSNFVNEDIGTLSELHQIV